MSGKLPQLRQGFDKERELIKLVNQLRRQLPAPAFLVIPIGPISLLEVATTQLTPNNVNGWRTQFVDIIPISIDGVQSSGADASVGTADSFYEDIVAGFNVGTALVEREAVSLTVTTPEVCPIVPIYFDVNFAGSGPTTLNVMVNIGGYFV